MSFGRSLSVLRPICGRGGPIVQHNCRHAASGCYETARTGFAMPLMTQRSLMATSASLPDTLGRNCVAVVGGGLTGATAAVHLAKHGYLVHVFDMGRATPGGRMSSRVTLGGLHFDHGAQFIGPPRTPKFAELLQEWVAAGIVAPWEGTAGTLQANTGTFTPGNASMPASNPCSAFGLPDMTSDGVAYVGTPSMGALVSAHLATQPDGVKLHTNTCISAVHMISSSTSGADSRSDSQQPSKDQGVAWRVTGLVQQGGDKVEREFGPYQAVIVADSAPGRQKPGASGHVALPTPDQALTPNQATLLDDARDAMIRLSSLQRIPIFALMAAWGSDANPSGAATADKDSNLPHAGPNSSLLGFSRACVTESKHLAWVSLDHTKPGRPSTPTLVALTSPDYAQQLLHDDYLETATGSGDSPGPGPSNSLARGGLPPQTREYLERRAQRMWQDIQPELTRARGGVPLPRPTHLAIHRWGSAATTPPLGQPCIVVTETLHNTATPGQSQKPTGKQAGKTAAGVPEQDGRGATLTQSQRTCFVVAGDQCLGPGIENAALSGLAAAEAVLHAAGRTIARL